MGESTELNVKLVKMVSSDVATVITDVGSIVCDEEGSADWQQVGLDITVFYDT